MEYVRQSCAYWHRSFIMTRRQAINILIALHFMDKHKGLENGK